MASILIFSAESAFIGMLPSDGPCSDLSLISFVLRSFHAAGWPAAIISGKESTSQTSMYVAVHNACLKAGFENASLKSLASCDNLSMLSSDLYVAAILGNSLQRLHGIMPQRCTDQSNS